MDIAFEDVISIFRRDKELDQFLNESPASNVELYMDYLPAFEQFLFDLPEELTLEELEKSLLQKPVGFRCLFVFRFSQFVDRVKNGYSLPTYKNLKDILVTELYTNHPEKIIRPKL